MKNNNKKLPGRTGAWLIFGLMLPLSACTTVEPWERGNLAKPQMAAEPYPGQRAIQDHAYGGREATIGGAAAQGGGCGCY
jgi:hypothetical protein